MTTAKTGTVKSKIKRGDTVVFIAGKEFNRYDSAGKRQPYRGKVIAVDARNGVRASASAAAWRSVRVRITPQPLGETANSRARARRGCGLVPAEDH